MQKMFKGNAVCPFTGNAIDSPACRQCRDFFKAGTNTFIWCKHPEPTAVQPERRKRGRPKKVQTIGTKPKTSPITGRKPKKR